MGSSFFIYSFYSFHMDKSDFLFVALLVCAFCYFPLIFFLVFVLVMKWFNFCSLKQGMCVFWLVRPSCWLRRSGLQKYDFKHSKCFRLLFDFPPYLLFTFFQLYLADCGFFNNADIVWNPLKHFLQSSNE